MDLKDFIAIKGKGDLFRIISKTPKGIIVETLNETKAKFKVEPNLQVLVLFDITIFTKDNTDLYLKEVFMKIYEHNGLNIPMDQKDDAVELKKYFTELIPNHDDEKVYISDIKKIVKWYSIVAKWFPEVIENLSKEEVKDEDATEEKKDPIPAETEESIAEVTEEKEGLAGEIIKEAEEEPVKVAKPKKATKKTVKPEDPGSEETTEE